MKTFGFVSQSPFKTPLLALCLAVGACAPSSEVPNSEVPASVVQPSFKGTLGNVVDFDGVPEVTGFQDSGYMFLDVRTRGNSWAAMTGLHLYGVLGEGQFAVGKHLTVNNFDVWSDEPRLDMVGCSGYRDGDWDYDCGPDEIDLRIAEGRSDDEFRLDVIAMFDDDCDGDDDRQPVEATFYVVTSELALPQF